MQKLRTAFKLIFLSLILSAIIGCTGFTLRGSLNVPQYLQTVYITPNDPYDPFQRELRLRLTRAEVKIVSQPGKAITVLDLSKPEFTEQILAYSTSGQIQRGKLSYSVKYKLITYDGSDINDNNTVTRTREISKSNNQLLTNESEQLIVRRELLSETVTELLRQITNRPQYKAAMHDSSTTNDNPC